ncbi:MAG: rod shape-determining protein MreC [Firmicutes bacterium]|nr:rod shape-determining protein MreC [Bacillota bacterium]
MNQTTRKVIGLLGLVIVLLSMIYYTGVFRSHYTFAEDLLLTGLSPVQGFFSRIGRKTYCFFQGMFDYERVLAENEMLREKIAERDNLSYKLLELQKENHRLREMLGFESSVEYSLLPAEVIARDPSYWFETITINKGYDDGVKKDMAVVTSQGLVGSIYYASKNSSQVLMLTDSRRAVSALVQRSREPGSIGIVEGYPEKSEFLRMVNLPPDANIQKGDVIISSGLGDVFPRGLVIGHVTEVEKDQYGLLQQALVEPAVNFNRLEEVFIVIEYNNEISGGPEDEPDNETEVETDEAENGGEDGEDDEGEILSGT